MRIGAVAAACLAAAVVVSGCAHRPQLEGAPGPTLVLEEFFAGRTAGEGVFRNVWTGYERPFTVTIEGTWDGQTLTLVEDFVYADGEIDRKTWVLSRQPDGTYTGTREDVVGTARAYRDGAAMRLEYDVVLGTGPDAVTVTFWDVLGVDDTGTLTNLAEVSKWGVRVGRVSLTLTRTPES